MRHAACSLLLASLLLPLRVDGGEVREVSLGVDPGVTAGASYWEGERDSPAVLVLHGFLQTRNFPTVRRLAEALAENGVTVLLPTLALGVDGRSQSLACEAIHTHDMHTDVDEIRRWVDWLYVRAGRPVVPVGHSAGSIQILAYLLATPGAPVREAGLISLTYFGDARGGRETPRDAAAAEAALRRGDDSLHSYGLNYCASYVTTPGRYLSYYRWSGPVMLEAISRVHVPLSVIYGMKDDRIDRPWLAQLQGRGVGVRPVHGANHFFDQTHEFDLLENVEALLEGVRR